MNCERDLSFRFLVDEYYNRAAEIGTKTSPKLDFMLEHFDNIAEFSDQLKALDNEFINRENMYQIIEKVPKNMKIQKKSAQSLLSLQIEFVVHQRTETFKYKKTKVLANIIYQLHDIEGYQELKESFVNWSQNPTDKEHMVKAKCRHGS